MPGTQTDKSYFLNNSPDEEQASVSKQLDPTTAMVPPLAQAAPPSPTSDDSMGSIPDESDVEDVFTMSSDAKHKARCQAFHNKHISELATQVSYLLKDIVDRNDRIPFTSERLTRFHSRAPPGISIRDYLVRIIKFCSLDKAILLVVLYFVDLFSQSYAHFSLNTLTVHRFLITAATVASKGLCDQFCSNTHYAKVGGVSVVELNLLEVEFLTRVHYRIIPPTNLLWQYYVKSEEKPIGPPLSQSASRKHAREDNSAANSVTPPPPNAPQPKPKGLKAVRDTFRFLQPSKKKKEDDISNA